MARRELTLPRLGETMESARLVRWLKAPGDVVQRGETLLELETDKTIVELPALIGGRLLSQDCAEGDEVEVGTVIGQVEVEGEGEGEGATDKAAPEKPPPAPVSISAPISAAVSGATAAVGSPSGSPAIDAAASGDAPDVMAANAANATTKAARQRQRATPAARAAARAAGVDLGAITGTGRRGRVEQGDVQSLASPTGPCWVDSHAAAGRSRASVQQTVLLVHGFAADRSAWAALTSALASDRLRVLVPDLPGHGQHPLEADDLDGLVAPLHQWLATELAEGALHLVGHSMGAVVATRLALRLGARAASLTLVAPAGLGREIAGDFVHGMARVQGAGELSHLLRRLGPQAAQLSDPWREAMAAALARGRLQALAAALATPDGAQRLDLVAELARLPEQLPVRAVFGARDQIIPPQHLQHLPPRVGAHWFAESGHMPMWDQPRELLALLRQVVALTPAA